jgi:tetratricopeptide (TPR) repeat protein
MRTIFSFMAAIALGFVFALVALAQKPDDDPMGRAFTAFQSGNNEKAIAELTEAIKVEPGNADAYLLRGSLRATSGDSAGALADISKVIEIKPDLGSVYYQRAMLRLAANDVNGALKDLDSAIVNSYKVDHVYELRGVLRSQRGDYKGALVDLDEAIKLNPHNPRSYIYRADLLFALGDMDRGLADLNYLLTWYETDPTKRPSPKPAGHDNKPATGQAGPDVVGSGSKQWASNMVTVGVEVQTANESPADKEMVPVIAEAYVRRGEIYSKRGNRDGAIADFTKSIRISPTIAWAFYDRAVEVECLGDLAGALADVNKAIELEPLNGNCRVERGVILFLQGKSKEAQVDFDTLLGSDSVLWQKRIDDRIAAVKKKLPSHPQ